MTNNNNQGRKTELVKSALINYIKDNQLAPGDRIPTQSELRRMLGVGNAVIGRAIKTLTDDGILQSCGRNGVVVIDTSAAGYQGRSIGIICHRDTEYPISAVLMQSLGIALNESACQMRFFIKNSPEKRDCFNIGEFNGALKAVEKQQISGLFSTMLLDDESVRLCEKFGVPLLYVGVSNPNATYIKSSYSIENYFTYASECSYRRPMLIHMGHPVTDEVCSVFEKNVIKNNFSIRKNWQKYCCVIRENQQSSWELTDNIGKAIQIIRDVSSWDPDERPDVLIIPDDMIATWTAQELSRANWQPDIIHSEVKQLAYSWPLRQRGAYVCTDCNEIARLAVDSLLKLIRGEKIPKMVTYFPEFIKNSVNDMC